MNFYYKKHENTKKRQTTPTARNDSGAATEQGLMHQYIKTRKACEMMDCHYLSLRRWRQAGELIEGIHWFRIGSRKVVYDAELLSHWIATRNNPELHEARIQERMKTLEAKGAA